METIEPGSFNAFQQQYPELDRDALLALQAAYANEQKEQIAAKIGKTVPELHDLGPSTIEQLMADESWVSFQT